MPETARSLIRRALLLLGATSSAEALPADVAQDALAALNDMVASWSLERFNIYHTPRLEVPMVPGQAVYTWGLPGGAIAQPRPLRLESALYQLAGDVPQEWPIAVWTQAEYEQGVWLKQLASLYPVGVYLESSYPLARLHVYTVPQEACTLILFPWLPLTGFPTLDTPVSLPEGYARLLRYALAIEVAPEFGIEPSPAIVGVFSDARRNIKNRNAVIPTLGMPVGLSPGGSRPEWTAIYRGDV